MRNQRYNFCRKKGGCFLKEAYINMGTPIIPIERAPEELIEKLVFEKVLVVTEDGLKCNTEGSYYVSLVGGARPY